MSGPTESEIKARVQAAVTSARQRLGTGGYGANTNADRAGAYLDLARALLAIYRDTGGQVRSLNSASVPGGAIVGFGSARPDRPGVGMGGNEAIFQAAQTLLVQAQITTYSGNVGALAIFGNLNAAQKDPTNYNIALDDFSYRIDDAVLRMFEASLLRTGSYRVPTSNEIFSTDYLVWDSLNLGKLFLGITAGIYFDRLGADSPVWAVATADQRRRLSDQSFSSLSVDGGVVSAGIFDAISRDGARIGKTALSYGFTTEQVNQAIRNRGSANAVANDDNSYRLSVDEFGVQTITNASTGVTVQVDAPDSDLEVMGQAGNPLGLIASPFLTNYTNEELNRIKDGLGADTSAALGGTRFQPPGGVAPLQYNRNLLPQCFTSKTPVLMADGTERPIEDIVVGDLVMAFDGFGPLEPAAVSAWMTIALPPAWWIRSATSSALVADFA